MSIKILFKQKQWLVLQIIVLLLGVIYGVFVKTVSNIPIGGFTIGTHYFASPQEFGLQLIFMLFSDLAFNVEYIQGTFLTHLTCGKSRKQFFIDKLLVFYAFISIQILFAYIVISLGGALITGHFGFEGFNTWLLEELKESSIIKPYDIVLSVITSILRMYAFIAFAIFFTTLYPGKLAVGGVASMGAFIGTAYFLKAFKDIITKSVILRIVANFFSLRAVNFLTWIFAFLWVIIFALLSIKRIKALEIPSRGV